MFGCWWIMVFPLCWEGTLVEGRLLWLEGTLVEGRLLWLVCEEFAIDQAKLELLSEVRMIGPII